MNSKVGKKRLQKKYQLPVIAHYSNRVIRFNTILEAERYTGINYTMIFEACIKKLYKAGNIYWEFENREDFTRYKDFYNDTKETIAQKTKH
ncbi:MAG: hypothetical protein JXJ22_00260 [Bacteroidales bacterium]|nr:hypothetical protein [Bacteroidales bacterium]